MVVSQRRPATNDLAVIDQLLHDVGGNGRGDGKSDSIGSTTPREYCRINTNQFTADMINAPPELPGLMAASV